MDTASNYQDQAMEVSTNAMDGKAGVRGCNKTKGAKSAASAATDTDTNYDDEAKKYADMWANMFGGRNCANC